MCIYVLYACNALFKSFICNNSTLQAQSIKLLGLRSNGSSDKFCIHSLNLWDLLNYLGYGFLSSCEVVVDWVANEKHRLDVPELLHLGKLVPEPDLVVAHQQCM